MNWLSALFPIIDRLVPDPKAKQNAQAELIRMQHAGELAELEARLKVTLGQLDVNKAEALHKSMFVAGWRPWIGWVCGTGFAFQFVVRPLLCWLSGAQGWPMPPELDMGDLLTVLAGMLGLGAMRTTEKIKGVTR